MYWVSFYFKDCCYAQGGAQMELLGKGKGTKRGKVGRKSNIFSFHLDWMTLWWCLFLTFSYSGVREERQRLCANAEPEARKQHVRKEDNRSPREIFHSIWILAIFFFLWWHDLNDGVSSTYHLRCHHSIILYERVISYDSLWRYPTIISSSPLYLSLQTLLFPSFQFFLLYSILTSLRIWGWACFCLKYMKSSHGWSWAKHRLAIHLHAACSCAA